MVGVIPGPHLNKICLRAMTVMAWVRGCTHLESFLPCVRALNTTLRRRIAHARFAPVPRLRSRAHPDHLWPARAGTAHAVNRMHVGISSRLNLQVRLRDRLDCMKRLIARPAVRLARTHREVLRVATREWIADIISADRYA